MYRAHGLPRASERVWIPRFNYETNVKFIGEYKKHPCLWDPNHRLYGKHAPRFRAYEAIARAMNYPGLDAASVRAKIKILRSCYISSRKQIATKSGSMNPHKPVDWFWTADAFLHNVIRLGFREPPHIASEYKYLREQHDREFSKTNPNASEAEVYFGSDAPVSSAVEVTESVDEDEEPNHYGTPKRIVVKSADSTGDARLTESSIYLELDDEQLMAIENGEMSIEEITAKAEAAASQHQQEMAARANDHSSAVDDDDDDDEGKSRAGDDGSEAEDEFDAFGRCVALQLRTLPIDTALELESQIHGLITRKRMTLLKQNKRH